MYNPILSKIMKWYVLWSGALACLWQNSSIQTGLFGNIYKNFKTSILAKDCFNTEVLFDDTKDIGNENVYFSCIITNTTAAAAVDHR